LGIICIFYVALEYYLSEFVD